MIRPYTTPWLLATSAQAEGCRQSSARSTTIAGRWSKSRSPPSRWSGAHRQFVHRPMKVSSACQNWPCLAGSIVSFLAATAAGCNPDRFLGSPAQKNAWTVSPHVDGQAISAKLPRFPEQLRKKAFGSPPICPAVSWPADRNHEAFPSIGGTPEARFYAQIWLRFCTLQDYFSGFFRLAETKVRRNWGN